MSPCIKSKQTEMLSVMVANVDNCLKGLLAILSNILSKIKNNNIVVFNTPKGAFFFLTS